MRITALNLKIISGPHLFLSLENSLTRLIEEFGMGSFAGERKIDHCAKIILLYEI